MASSLLCRPVVAYFFFDKKQVSAGEVRQEVEDEGLQKCSAFCREGNPPHFTENPRGAVIPRHSSVAGFAEPAPGVG